MSTDEARILSGQTVNVVVGGKPFHLHEPSRRQARRMQVELMPIYKAIAEIEQLQNTEGEPDNLAVGRLAFQAASDIADFFEAHKMVNGDALENATEDELITAFTEFVEMLNAPFAPKRKTVPGQATEPATPTGQQSPDSTK